MEITAMKPRRKRLTALYLDGEFAVNVDTETLELSGLRIGGQIGDEELHDLLQRSDRRRAKEKALYLLEHRAHSKKELTEKIARTASPEVAQEAAQKMEDLGLVDDEGYAREYADSLLNRKGFAVRRAQYELEQKGIDRDLAQEIIEELAPDPIEKITEILQRRYTDSLGDEKRIRRCTAALQRLGYRWEEIRSALKQFTSEELE